MQKKQKNKVASNDLQRRFAKAINKLLKDIKISPWVAGFIIVIQFSQLILSMMEFDYFQMPPIYYTIFTYFNLLLPYCYFTQITQTVCFIILIVSIVIVIVLYYGFIFTTRTKNVSTTVRRGYTLFIYLYEYVIFLPLAGALLSIYFYPNNLTQNAQQNFMASFAILFVLLVIPYILSAMFFFNFSLRSKDAFARSPDLTHFFMRVLFILMVLFDVAIYLNYYSLKVAVNMLLSIAIIVEFVNRLPYYHYTVTLFYIFAAFFYFWVNLLTLFTVVIYIKLIKDNILITVVVGLVLFLWNLYSFKDYLFNRLINQDFNTLSNFNHLERKVRYFLLLIKNSKKSTVDELRLASIIQLHSEGCLNEQCVCKNRASAWDPRKKAGADLSVPVFKDFIFLKNLLLVMLRENIAKLFGAPSLNLTYILFLFEVLNNFGMADQESALFLTRFGQPTYAAFRFCLLRVRLLMQKELKRSNRQYPYALNHYENLLVYDRGFETLKLDNKRKDGAYYW